MKIHREGHIIIPVAFMSLLMLYALLFWMIPILIIKWILGIVALIFWGLIVYFFRDPQRSNDQQENMVYSPCDGKVVVIEKVYEGEVLKEDRMQVSIFMSPLNVHVNRSPVKGKVSFFKYHKGKYLVAWHPKSSTHNERTTIGYKVENGLEIVMRQIAGAVARRIAFYPKVGKEVSQGSEVGFIRFGSRVDLFLPLDAEIKVRIGDVMVGGESEVAVLKA